ncbi:CRE-FAAH-3 protein [Caenorhabditis remanei]|uniref:CRE-FAAH-3 protein n=1 Tax=Caenorhabditis remanei TaxID=31234 RepID=E3MXT2_CAERE|nr:CRE-FAAH-3 protein [Caenorhabditis remanei]
MTENYCLSCIGYYALIPFAVYALAWIIDNYNHRQKLKVLVKQRAADRKVNFEWAKNNFEKLDERRAAEITAKEFEELKNSLQNGEIGPVETVRAFQRKAFEATEKTNCVCLFIQDAMETAQHLEDLAKDPSYQKPPLFGVPVSIKESIHVKNMDSTLGYSQNINKPSESNSLSVDQLIRLGAIPFVHTNLPIALLSYGCSNPVYGTTSNPLDTSRVPGGSSGGESALVALGGSVLGIGTDVGGSIRTPASFCGIAGFKSSSDRTPQLGKTASIPGRQLLLSVEGPLAKNIDVCTEYLRLKWNDAVLFEKDVYLPPVRFQYSQYMSKEPLRIGFYTNDGYQRASPAYERAVRETVQVLKDLGHTLVEFEVPQPDHMYSIFCAGATADGGHFLMNSLANDIIPPEANIGFPVARLPHFIQRILRRYWPNRRERQIIQELPHDTEEMRKMHEKIEDYRHDFVLAMRAKRLDAIVCPSFGCPPPHHGVPNKLLSASSYTALYNLIDFAAGTVPITVHNAADEIELRKVKTEDSWDRKIVSESKNCDGLPVAVQIAAPPFREEMCLRLLKEVESKIGLYHRRH